MMLRIWLLSWSVLGMVGVVSAQQVPAANQRWAPGGSGGVPGFMRHVQPLLGKLGCSNRACHGSFQGKGGFRLSLFSSDPQRDHDGLVKEERVAFTEPDESLILMKATNRRRHKGGQRFPPGSWQHQLLRAWITAGAPYQPGREATVVRLDVQPAEIVFAARGAEAGLRVVATFSDRTTEDVTALTQFSSNDDGVATVDTDARVTAGLPGDTAIVATFGGAVRTVPVLIPRPGPVPAFNFPANSHLDDLIAAKLRKLGVTPSELCTDDEFLRRVSVDITGTLPTPGEVEAFRADAATDKRTRKIDELLERPTYAVWWTTKLCDLTGLNAPAFLGGTEFASLVGDQWQRWIERRVRDNVGYDQLVEGIVLATSRRPGQSYEDFAREQSLYTRTKDPLDYAAQPWMPHFWHRSNVNQPEEKALAFAYSFLGVRLDCAQCHKHPFDVWTQQDFQQFTALFERIRTGISPEAEVGHQKLQEGLGLPIKKTAAERRGLYLKLARAGQPAPWREVYVAAPNASKRKETGKQTTGKLLGGPEVDVSNPEDPRRPLMNWLCAPDNPYFARALVNRVWAHYFGRGIVDPPDDHHQGNPPSHPELLDWLARSFINSGYDMKWLHRTLAGSRTYQLSWRTNATNREDRNFSHAAIRRLPAEVAIDALRQATAGSKQLNRATTDVKDRRIGVQATADSRRLEFGLAVFGKPLRQTNCDCEREVEPSLVQAIFLRNDKDLYAAIDRADGWLQEIRGGEPDTLIREAYLRTLSRLPDVRELERSRRHLAQADRPVEGLRDLLWALLNTQEFITNH